MAVTMLRPIRAGVKRRGSLETRFVLIDLQAIAFWILEMRVPAPVFLSDGTREGHAALAEQPIRLEDVVDLEREPQRVGARKRQLDGALGARLGDELQGGGLERELHPVVEGLVRAAGIDGIDWQAERVAIEGE